ncbi:glycosyltransferase family 2 protein [Falsiroseomonas oryziterrae]|uniref:glycosyltransferase family 2 protein n=1 Tax=Falsiroseomonas oryziterrae TaxID=2911368 RepID=UPI001F1EAD5E|nr:glycosyltransferase family A protein [Roseomonas sp. NPKOSM-4]
MMFSLVMATRGRTREIAEFLDSLLAQGRADAEVIVVDQNGDDRLEAVLTPYAGRVTLTHLRSAVANANHARNLGLRAARGAIVGFPDDDCVYPAGLLDRVVAAFADPALTVLTGPAESPAGGLGSGRWRESGGPIDAATVWTSVIEFNLWLRRPVALALGGFDEGMGPGTPLGSAEGNDLVLRAVSGGHVARYDPTLRVIHPDKRLTDVAVARARLYGRGFGYALRRHGVPASVWLPFAVRPLGGVVLSLLRLRPHEAGYYAMTLLGRAEGFLRSDAASGRVRPALEAA